MASVMRPLLARWRHPRAEAESAGPAAAHPVTIRIDAESAGPVVPDDFAGLGFERGPLNPGNAGVTGYLFSPENDSLVTLFRNLAMHNLRLGGGSVDNMFPAGADGDFTGIDNLFAFARVAGVKIIYTLRMLNRSTKPIRDLETVDAQVAGHIWRDHRDNVASFAIGNEPDWHDFHSYAGRPADPAIYEEISGIPGSAYPSYRARWEALAAAIAEAAPGAPLSAPDTGAYSPLTWTPNPEAGVSWTERFAVDERGSGRMADFTQHLYVGGDPGKTTAAQAISNMLSPEWVHGTAVGNQPAGTTYTPYPWFFNSHLAAVSVAGQRYRLTESNDYLGGVPGASNAFASALWALDYLHWWAAHGAAGVNFHNKQWLYTDTIVPDPATGGARYMVTPKGYGIKAFTLASAGQVKPVTVDNTDGVNLTAYCIGASDEDYVTIINKTHGAQAADAEVIIVPPGPARPSAQLMTLASEPPGDATQSSARLGGAAIAGDGPWNGTWDALPESQAGVTLTVKPASAVIVRIRYQR
jgi:hypothetical protein